MTTSYWSRRLMSRRAALRSAAAAGGGIAALSLAGCGGDDDDDSGGSTGDAAAVDSTKGKPGGTFKFVSTGFRPYSGVDRDTRWWELGGLTHSGLLAHSWGQQSVAEDDWLTLEGDAAQALPEQPDETTYTFKLRPGIKFHNGRTMTAEDVVYSLDRWANYPESVQKARWAAWFERAEAPDAQTVRVKSKAPFADGVVAFGTRDDGFIFAKEHEETNARTEGLMGSGPWMFVEGVAPVSVTFKRNPDYYIKPYPYFDGMQLLAYTDPFKRVADFVAGQLQLPWLVYALEREEIKKQRPEAVYQSVPQSSLALYMRTDMAPYKDKRVRQALSMSIDRKKIREATTQGEGEPDQFLNLVYRSILGGRQVKDLGASARYWNYDPTAAKALMAAAGITQPFEANHYHAGAGAIGPIAPDTAILSIAGWRDNGIANIKPVEQTPAQASSTTGRGLYEGQGTNTTGGLSNAPALALAIRDVLYTSPSGEFKGGSNRGHINDPRLNALAEKQLGQLKAEDRKATYREIETIMAEEQYTVFFSTTTQTWFMDPKLQNARMSPTPLASRRYWMRWWYA